jgi:pimeloyl-ACP methyl ester carboxylesterase
VTAEVATGEKTERIEYQGYGYAYRILPCPEPATEPLVVISGAYQGLRGFRRYDKFWSGQATIIGVDLPGSHSADPIPHEFGYEFQAAALGHLIDTLGLPKVNILGVSNGYPPVHRYAQANPDRIARMVLSGASYWMQSIRDTWGEIAKALDENRMDDFADIAIKFFFNTDPDVTILHGPEIQALTHARLRAIQPGNARRFIDVALRGQDHELVTPGGIRGIETLCLTGQFDSVATPETCRPLAADIEGAVFTMIRDTDHMSSAERPAEWAGTLMKFLTGQPLDGLEYLTPLEHPSETAAVNAG